MCAYRKSIERKSIICKSLLTEVIHTMLKVPHTGTFLFEAELLFFTCIKQTTNMEQQHHLSDLTIDSVTAEQIRSIAGWAKFLSIIGFILCAVMLLAGIFAGSIFSSMGDVYGSGSTIMTGMGTMMTIIYIIFAIIWFIPTLFMYQSASKLKMALNTTDQGMLNEGFMKLKATFRFWGIVTIIILSFYAIIILFALLGSAIR